MSIKNINNFPKIGYSVLNNLFDTNEIKIFKKNLKSIMPNLSKVFYKSKKSFYKNTRFKKITPGVYDHNILLDNKINLDFIEKNKKFNKLIKKLFKSDYFIEEKWLLRNTPTNFFPLWLKKEIKDIGMPQLNMYVQEKYRNISYIYGLDYHQDNGGRKRDSITIIIYLDDVLKLSDTPIRILPKTHMLGATQYPHYCRPSSDKKRIIYSDFLGNHITTEDIKIFGKSGCSIIFNGYVLHGSEPSKSSDKDRLALRYVLSPKKVIRSSPYQKSYEKIISRSFYEQDYRLDKYSNGYNKKCGKVLNYVK